MTRKYYWCDKNCSRVSVVNNQVRCDCYRQSEIQEWCAMGKLPDDCGVSLAVQRNESSASTPEKYFAELRRLLRKTRREVLTEQKRIARLNAGPYT